ncbi:hypothetical protein VOLCADRAFT_94255 [Volvox carteri f. nagariensis]|uniref:EF-hand domain-containing protein n=1 Tax=Volvox carteri f. nagariensis TaxID=3068 RepID=D8U410_VOLCA|nr:uncharacterized protein VOLCADRAFT_94255 [Volvox carteri f. nagariensis]EFJ45415.1 hypothetical protein VOLCADRAFT_94255 [Volvox carteri f. nagariensis]|eukprot:XP_002953442.1 hypothetical protein VOLCADRAFT_94255 [Volvox carteri f. nagariensis]
MAMKISRGKAVLTARGKYGAFSDRGLERGRDPGAAAPLTAPQRDQFRLQRPATRYISDRHLAQGQLPPLINAWTDTGGTTAPSPDPSQSGGHVGQGGGAKPLALSQQLAPMSVSQRLYGSMERPRTVGSAGAPGSYGPVALCIRHAANAKLPQAASGGPNPNPNPWEALQEAAPATRYGGNTARESGGLALIMPTGSSRASMVSFENRLLSYLQPLSGPAGTAALVSGGVSPMRGPSRPATSPPRPPTSPPRPPTSPSRPPTSSRGASSPPRPASSPKSPGSPPRVSACGIATQSMTLDSVPLSMAGSAGPVWGAVAAAVGPPPGPHGPSLPPLVPRSALHSALVVPAPGAEPPWGGAGLPHGMYSALADLRGGITAGVASTPREAFQNGGMNAVAAAAVASAADASLDDIASPPSLGHMITFRPSNRRQVQLMADWLDHTIGLLWEQHLAAAKAAADGKGPVPAGPGAGGTAAPTALSGSPSANDVSMRSQAATGSGASGASGSGGPRRVASAAASATPSGSKAALAIRFGSVTAGLKDLSSSLYHVATDTQLWSSMVEATAAVTNAVIQNVAHRCWEEGALLARLWNLNTALMDSGLAAARKAQQQLSATAAEQAAKIRRLDPLIDWELESRTAREELTTALEDLLPLNVPACVSTCATTCGNPPGYQARESKRWFELLWYFALVSASRAEALLAGRERDALLRENDKIIAHYRKELKTYRREQRRNAYRLARKLRNTQQQLELMTRDRDVLYNAVSYTKSQTAQLVDVITGLQGHLRAVISGAGGGAGAGGGGNGKVSFEMMGEEAFPELQQVEHGLKNILHSLQKVRDVTQDAEDSHFVTEEQVTAVAAADTTGDELVDEVLAEGDPEPSPEELEAEAAAAAALERQHQHQQGSDSDYDSDEPDPNSALSMLAEAALRGTGESSEDGEDDDGDDYGAEEEAEEGGPGQGAGGSGDGGLGGEEEAGQDGGAEGRGLFSEISPAAGADDDAFLEDEEGGRAGPILTQDGELQPGRSLQTRSSTASPTLPGMAGDEDSAAGSRTPLSRSVSRTASRSASPDVVAVPRSASGTPTGPPDAAGGGGGGGGGGGNANRQDNKNKKKGKNKNKNRGNAGGGGGRGTSGRGLGPPGATSFGPGGGGGGGSINGGDPGAVGGEGQDGYGSVAGSGTRSTPAGSLTQIAPQDPHLAHGGGGSQGHGHSGRGSGAIDGHGGPLGTASTIPGSISRSASPTTPLPRGRVFNLATNGCQTGPELLKGVADPDIAEAAKQMKALREALGEIGIVGNPNDDADGTDGLLTALRQYMSSLSSEAGTLTKQLEKLKVVAESAEASRADLAQTAEARGREVAAVRRELLDAKKRYSQLCNTLEALGIDPRNPTLPSHTDGESVGSPVDGGRVAGSRGSIKAGRDSTGEGKSSKGTKVSRLAAVKEKARERAMAATVPQAPVLGRTSTTAPRGGGNTGYAASGNRVMLPAAMLAAAQQRAAEAAAAGEEGTAGSIAAGGGNVAATISAWRAGGGGAAAAGGGGSGQTPVYIRPDRAAATARLQDALTRYADAKPRTLEWLLKLIDSMYRGKATNDEQRSKIGQEPLTMIEYMFQHLSGQYGTKDLVNQYAAQLVATCLQYCANDPRVGTFQRFLMEEWDTRVLCAYMDATRRLQEPSRVPCCDFPADYLPSGARKNDSAPVDVRKALWVAERVLMRRSPKAAYVFAQLLSSKAESITAAEMDSYFVSPGSYGAELQQVRQFELGRGEFKRISSAVFLDALCGEYARMESIFREMLPELFSQYDSDGDGWITKHDVSELFSDIVGDMAHAGMQLPVDSAAAAAGGVGGAGGAGGGGGGGGLNAATLTESEREAALEALWTVLSTAEVDARNRADSSLVYPDGAVRPPGGGMVSASAVTHLSDSGFFEGAFRSDFVRAWARAFKTGAAQLPGGLGALAEMDLHAARDAARRLLSVLVTRHWTHHGETLEGYFADAGALAEQQLKQQAALLEGDMGGSHGDGRDGPRRAAALCTVLRLLLVKKADRFSSLLTAENLTGGPHNGPPSELEELLERLTAAVRLLYGPHDSIWVVGAEMDELESLSGLDAADVGALPAGYKRWLARVAVRCCALHDRLHLSLPQCPLIPHLQTHRGVPFYARMWRRATAAAVAARRRATISRTPPFAAMRTTNATGSGGGTGTGTGASVSSTDKPPATPTSPAVKTAGGANSAITKRPASGMHLALRQQQQQQQQPPRALSPQLSLPSRPSNSGRSTPPPLGPLSASVPVPLVVPEPPELTGGPDVVTS